MEKSKKLSKKLWNIVDKTLIGGSGVVMALMAILVVVTVILRYVFNITYVWSEEATLYLFVMTTYFGSVVCVKEMEHIDIPYFRDMAPKTAGFIMDIFVGLTSVAIMMGLAFFSFTWIEKTGSSIIAGINMPYYSIYLIFPISFILMAIYSVRRMEQKIVPDYEETIESTLGRKLVDIMIALIYGGILYGIVYLYTRIDWTVKISKTVHPFMIKSIAVVYNVMFFVCFALIGFYFVYRLIHAFKKLSNKENGGEQ